MVHSGTEQMQQKRTAEEAEAARTQEVAQIENQLKRLSLRQLRLVKMICQGILSKD